MIPLEPYAAPPIQAIGPDGLEYPPRVVPPADIFEEMVRRFELVHHANKRRKMKGTSMKRETLSPELTADLAVSLQSIEEALRELLIAVDLSHVARATGQFIGYDSIAGSASAQLSSTILSVPHIQGGVGSEALELSHIAPEVILGMKKESFVKAATHMKGWISRTRWVLQKSRCMVQEIRALRRCARLRIASGGRNGGAMSRPLSAADALSLYFERVGCHHQALVPFDLDETGRPILPAVEEQHHKDLITFRVIDGLRRVSATTSYRTGLFLSEKGGGDGEDLSTLVHGLADEAYVTILFNALREEVSGPGQKWIDRHGLGGISRIRGKKQFSRSSAEGKDLGGTIVCGISDSEGAMLRVVHCGENQILIEIDDVHVLEISKGISSILTQSDDQEEGAEKIDEEGEETATALLRKRLGELSKWAMLHILEMGTLKEGKGNDAADLLLTTSHLLAHRQCVQHVIASLQKVLRDVDIDIQARWVDYSFEEPRSRLVLVDDAFFMIDIIAQNTQVCISHTDTMGGATSRVSLSRMKEMELYLEKFLAKRATS